LERGLKLFIDRDIKLSDIDLSTKNNTKIPRKINKITGKESTTKLAFSEPNWGSKTRGYMKSITRRHADSIPLTIGLARTVAKARKTGGKTDEEGEGEEESDDERAQI
ncbi:hypothetical protein BV22DRAFT_1000484, partial [Leucogyrophana mollusca]